MYISLRQLEVSQPWLPLNIFVRSSSTHGINAMQKVALDSKVVSNKFSLEPTASSNRPQKERKKERERRSGKRKRDWCEKLTNVIFIRTERSEVINWTSIWRAPRYRFDTKAHRVYNIFYILYISRCYMWDNMRLTPRSVGKIFAFINGSSRIYGVLMRYVRFVLYIDTKS